VLRRLSLRDVVIVAELELDFGAGFTVFTGETGAGKSILIDALQLALGQRADASLVREGALRAEVSAEFDTPDALRPWLDAGGFQADDTLLLRRTVDAQGKSRAWVNGSPATVTQLREAADHLVDIHGQHAWQSLTRPAAVRTLLDQQAQADTTPLQSAWHTWRGTLDRLQAARAQRDGLERERERLAWQIAELDKVDPRAGEWEPLNAEHQRLANGQALLDGARRAHQALAEDEPSASALTARALAALDEVLRYDADLAGVADVLRTAQAQLDDAAHTLAAYLNHREPNPERLAELDNRIAAWMGAARRHRRSAPELPALLAQWKHELQGLDAAADLQGLEAAAQQAEHTWRTLAEQISRLRRNAAPRLASAVTQAMQHLGMAGGRFEVAVLPLAEPQASGLDAVELRVAGHAGSTPRALAKVASGGELSRLALAIAVSTASGTAHAKPGMEAAVASKVANDKKAARGIEKTPDKAAVKAPQAAASAASAAGTGAAPAVDRLTLIFDEIDAGVGGTVADSVGRLMKQLGRSHQVMAVTHLAQVAACGDRHFVVSKALRGRQTLSAVAAVEGETRVAEVARMLGGETLSGTAHAQALLGLGEQAPS
jgi:DNA repair protein RecN (Recombination protein N)